jgi:PEP-CTERM motif
MVASGWVIMNHVPSDGFVFPGINPAEGGSVRRLEPTCTTQSTTMTTSVKLTLAAVLTAALAPLARAQIVPPLTPGPTTFGAPGYASNVSQYASDLGDLYFDSNLTVPSSIQTWSNGPVNLSTVFGSNPFLAGGGSIKTIFLGETAGWKNDFIYTTNTAPNTWNVLATDIENDLLTDGNIKSGWESTVEYGAGQTLDFALNSGGGSNEGGLFFAFGRPNMFSGSDNSVHTRWSVRDVTTTYFNGSELVTQDVKTLLVGFEDVRRGLSYYDGDFNDFVVGFQFLPSQMQAVPEPSTYGLLGGAALMGLVALRRFKRKA